MKHFTEEQIVELEQIFGIKRVVIEQEPERVQILDGVVERGDTLVWWHCSEGPELKQTKLHWYNIKEYPSAYSLKKPKWDAVSREYVTTKVYED